MGTSVDLDYFDSRMIQPETNFYNQEPKFLDYLGNYKTLGRSGVSYILPYF